MTLRLGLWVNMVRILLDPLRGKFYTFGLVLESGCRMRCKNSEIYKLYDEDNDVKFIKLGRLRWAGHLMMEEK
jgi:hypothetical protein